MVVRKDARLLNVGIPGCGPISQVAHLESVQKACNTALRAVCGADEGLANRFGAFYDAGRIYLDYDQMLADATVEAIIIATSDAFHVPAPIRALQAGKHVLCEKPIGLSVEEVLDLQKVVHATGKVLQVGHMLRFDPGIQSAHDFLRDEMGEVLDLARYLCGPITEVQARHREKYGALSWFVDVEFENRALGHPDLTLSVRMGWHEGFQI